MVWPLDLWKDAICLVWKVRKLVYDNLNVRHRLNFYPGPSDAMSESQMVRQDTLLAQHLEYFLLTIGADHAISPPGVCGMSQDSCDTSSPEPPRQYVAGISPILSYQHMVSSLLMRHWCRARRVSGYPRKQGGPRRPSSLAECVSIHLSDP